MSGRPDQESVSKYRKLMKMKAESDQALDEGQRRLAQNQRDVDHEQRRNNAYQKDLESLMKDMDVASTGNVGYADRLQCFLAEILRQERQETVDARTVNLAERSRAAAESES
jgi:hypothetical protein